MSSNDKTHGDGVAAFLGRVSTYTSLHITVVIINAKGAFVSKYMKKNSRGQNNLWINKQIEM